jgi:Putative beta-barrel porin-2, OmpL-like. bbp2
VGLPNWNVNVYLMGRFYGINAQPYQIEVSAERREERNMKLGKYEANRKYSWILAALLLSASSQLFAQQNTTEQPSRTPAATSSQQSSEQPSPPSPPNTLPTPPFTGPLQPPTPISFEAGPLGKLDFDGIVSGMGVFTGNAFAGDNSSHPAINNGFVFFQKADGPVQFYIQPGAYNVVSLGTPFLQTDKQIDNLWGPIPVAYLKFGPTKTTSIQIGALPTLIGAEYTFDFQNMNIERGLLWNQENAVNRGIQINQTWKKLTASFSWNDGFWSNRYSWLTGSLTYTSGPHSLSFQAGGNLDETRFQSLATPVQNNGTIYALVYTYTKGKWIVQPYFQYSSVPTNPRVGVPDGASTYGGAFLLSRTIGRGFSLAGRGEYITSTGTAARGSVNLLYGAGSAAWSATITPTYQYKHFFTRGELSFVRTRDLVPGSAFGPAGLDQNQPRGVIEAGFMF